MKKIICKFIVIIALTMFLLMLNSLEVQAKYLQEINLKVVTNITNQNDNDDEDLIFDDLSITYEKYEEQSDNGKVGRLVVSAIDSISGVKEIEIHLENEIIYFKYEEESEIKYEVTDYYEMDEDFPFYESVYIKGTDNSGNIKELNEFPNPDKIYNIIDFLKFREVINTGITNFESQTVYLMDNIDLGEVCSQELGISWTPIGGEEYNFSGIFEGNGYTISNLYISSEEDYLGLFYKIYGTLKNVDISGSIISNSANYIGGIAGLLNNGSIEYCRNYVTIEAPNSSYVGGLVGYLGSERISKLLYESSRYFSIKLYWWNCTDIVIMDT